MKSIVRLVSLMVLCTLSAAAYAGLNMQEGLWETALVMSGKAMPAEKKCYLKADVAMMEDMFLGKVVKPGDPCRYSDYKRSGNAVSYTMTCKFGKTDSTSFVTVSYNGDSAGGTIKTGSAVITTSSKRVGNCSQSSFSK